MRIVPIAPQEAFPLSASEKQSFMGAPTPCRINGPPGLVRIVMHRKKPKEKPEMPLPAEFWTSESVFSQLRDKAKFDLAQQGFSKMKATDTSWKEMIGLYMKYCLRNDLAICKDWTPNFDAYAVLPLRPNDSLVGWMGRIKSQPYYSKPHPAGLTKAEYEAKLVAHRTAVAGGVQLVATENQFVTRFDIPANQAYKDRILGPYNF